MCDLAIALAVGGDCLAVCASPPGPAQRLPDDLICFRRPWDFCDRSTTLDPGGDGFVLDVRSNDGPGSHTVLAHRTCLADRITTSSGECQRALTVGHPPI